MLIYNENRSNNIRQSNRKMGMEFSISYVQERIDFKINRLKQRINANEKI
jgi:hypothetical protein